MLCYICRVLQNHLQNNKYFTNDGGSALKTGRRKVTGSNSGRVCLPSVFRGFFRNSRKYDLGSFRKTPMEDTLLIGPDPQADNWP